MTAAQIREAILSNGWQGKTAGEIADLLNTRPRQTLGWKFPVEVLTDHLQLLATNRLNTIN